MIVENGSLRRLSAACARLDGEGYPASAPDVASDPVSCQWRWLSQDRLVSSAAAGASAHESRRASALVEAALQPPVERVLLSGCDGREVGAFRVESAERLREVGLVRYVLR